MARYLGVEQYGKYSFALSIITIGSIFVTLGLDRVLVKELRLNGDDEERLLGSCIGIKILGSIVAYLTVLAIGLGVPNIDRVILLLIFVMGLSFAFRWYESIEAWFQSKLISRYSVRVKTISILVSAITKVCLILIEAPLLWFSSIIVLEVFLSSILILFAFKNQGRSIWTLRPDRNVGKGLLLQSWPLMFSTLSGILYAQIDRILLGTTIGMRDVGIYAVYLQLIMIPRMMISSLNLSVNPVLVDSYKVDREKYWARLERALSLNAWIAIAAGVGLVVAGKTFILIVLGEEFLAPGLGLPILIAVSLLIQAPGSLRLEYMLLQGKADLIFYYRLGSVALNLLLNVLLIPRYGMIGAACAGVVTNLFFDFVSSSMSRQTRPYLVVYCKALRNALLQRPVIDIVRR